MNMQDPIVIVGGGAFGLSTAYELFHRGYRNITLLDKNSIPAPDAATTDINKIIRMDYGSDTLYQSMGLESIRIWESWDKDSVETFGKKLFHQTGVLYLSKDMTNESFEKQSLDTLRSSGFDSYIQETSQIPIDAYPALVQMRQEMPNGFLNTIGGWGHSGGASEYLFKKLQDKIIFKTGPQYEFKHLLFDKLDTPTVIGIATVSENIFGTVILCAGAWSTSLIPELHGHIIPTAQPVFHFRIPPSEQARFSNVVWAADTALTGFYGFPLNSDGIIKVANHGSGYTIPSNVPKTALSHPYEKNQVPMECVQSLREFCKNYYPLLNSFDISSTRLCWYSDSWDANFYITRVPGKNNLVIATGGSGHAFKFMPVLGRIVVDVFEGIHTEKTERFAWRSPSHGKHDGMRAGVQDSQPLLELESAKDDDLLA